MKHSAKSVRAFTLIELLIVVGIIGILIAAIMPMLGSSRDTALAVKCMTNMRNLGEAVIGCATAGDTVDSHGAIFPASGFYRYPAINTSDGKLYYWPRLSWISNYGDANALNRMSGNKDDLGSVVHFMDEQEQTRFAVTNGVVFRHGGNSFSIYQCPVHATACESASGRPPAWSYVMNQEFGCRDKGRAQRFPPVSISVPVQSGGGGNLVGRNPDKVLMFAEIQGVDVEDTIHGISLKAVTSGSGEEADSILQYDNESIGFNHPFGKNRRCGHVVFADGHVEKVVMPTEAGYIKDLTRYLCQGYDAPLDGKRYTPNNDDMQ